MTCWPNSLFSRMAVKTGSTEAAGATEGSPLKHFVSVQLPYVSASAPVSPITEPMYIIRDGTLRMTGGTVTNVLMLKYPLAGNFSFSHRNIRRDWGESHAQFGGTAYLAKPDLANITVRGLPARSSVVLDSKALKNNQDNRLTLDVTGDKVVMKVNEVEAVVDRRTASMPFLGLLFEHHTIAEIADISLQGEPVIPREVDLIGEDLRGWDCSLISGYLMPMLLPSPAGQDHQLLTRRAQYETNLERFSWFTADSELRNGQWPGLPNDGHQQHLQYQRPLLEGESISYEFFHEEGKQEVHPSIGRIGILLRPEGVKLRWLSQRQSLESLDLDPLHEVAPDERLGDGKPELRENDWNQVTLTLSGESVIVEVNGKPVCRLLTSLDQRFGLLGEQGRGCRVRAIRLTGPWPETLPENLFEAQGRPDLSLERQIRRNDEAYLDALGAVPRTCGRPDFFSFPSVTGGSLGSFGSWGIDVDATSLAAGCWRMRSLDCPHG